MSPSLSDHGHALQPDGTLKDASEILWTYDEDELLPFPLDSAPTSSSGSHVPATTVASVRRTTRVIRPSQRALDAAETSSSVPASAGMRPGVKRKAQADDSKPESGVTRTATIRFDDSDGSEDAPPTEVATEPEDDDYESIKAMADADNQVSFLSSLLSLELD